MLTMLMSTLLAILVPLAVMTTARIMSMRSNMDREKMSPFECGFDPKSTARIPFSMRFFLLAIIFIVFDIEIILLMPLPTMFFSGGTSSMLLITTLFLTILTIGLIHEWNEGSLDWSS